MRKKGKRDDWIETKLKLIILQIGEWWPFFFPTLAPIALARLKIQINTIGTPAKTPNRNSNGTESSWGRVTIGLSIE